MSETHVDFVSLVLAGEVDPGEIDDFIDRWHEEPGGMSLHDYLGMTKDEYAVWLRAPDRLAEILAAKAA